MGAFINYLSNPFTGLKNIPQVVIKTTTNSLWIQSLMITNTSQDDIRINLQFTRTVNGVITLQSFLAYNFLIPSYKNPREYKNTTLFNTLDLVDVLGIKKNLEYTSTLNESLIIYSNGLTQIFDCDVSYALLNELPMN